MLIDSWVQNLHVAPLSMVKKYPQGEMNRKWILAFSLVSILPFCVCFRSVWRVHRTIVARKTNISLVSVDDAIDKEGKWETYVFLTFEMENEGEFVWYVCWIGRTYPLFLCKLFHMVLVSVLSYWRARGVQFISAPAGMNMQFRFMRLEVGIGSAMRLYVG